MHEHSDYFKQFLSVSAASKRKTAKGKAYQLPSESAIDAAFVQHLKRMSQPGVYGDNIEVCAFARRYNCNVKIYQRVFAYVVTGDDEGGGERKMVHIAYHTWEHYSSIRNLGGPHKGLPEVKPVINPNAPVEGKKTNGGGKYALPWMVDMVMMSLPFLAPEEEVAKAIEECKGDVNEAVGRMLDQQYAEETSSEIQDPAVADSKAEGALSNEVSASPTPNTAGKEEEPPVSLACPTEPRKGNKNSVSSKNHAAPASSSKKNPTPKNPPQHPKPKRETARERKERQKAEARERKMSKGTKGANRETAKGKEARNSSSAGDAGDDRFDRGIRELYI